MNPYRFHITAGVALLATAVFLATGAHGVWWLLGLGWALGMLRGRRPYARACAQVRHRTGPAAAERSSAPDPTRDRHTAFPTSP